MTTIIQTPTISADGTVVNTTVRDPWKEPFKCPLLLYTILVILGLIINLAAVNKTPNVDRNGNQISNSQKWTAFIIGLIIYLVIAYLFGLWMYNLCKSGKTLNSWLVFLLAIFFPLILSIIVGIIISAILGISFFLFGY